MSTTKTPEQIADDVLAEDARSNWGMAIPNRVKVRNLLVAAIEADRAQRTLIDAVADALDGRGATAAAQLVRDTDPEDDLWNNYLGPMLDALEEDYTAMAVEINA